MDGKLILSGLCALIVMGFGTIMFVLGAITHCLMKLVKRW